MLCTVSWYEMAFASSQMHKAFYTHLRQDHALSDDPENFWIHKANLRQKNLGNHLSYFLPKL